MANSISGYAGLYRDPALIARENGSVFFLDVQLGDEQFLQCLESLSSQIPTMTDDRVILLISSLLTCCVQKGRDCRSKGVQLLSMILSSRLQRTIRCSLHSEIFKIGKELILSIQQDVANLERVRMFFEAFQMSWPSVSLDCKIPTLILWLLSIRTFLLNECEFSTPESIGLAKELIDNGTTAMCDMRDQMCQTPFLTTPLTSIKIEEIVFFKAIFYMQYFTEYYQDGPKNAILEQRFAMLAGNKWMEEAYLVHGIIAQTEPRLYPTPEEILGSISNSDNEKNRGVLMLADYLFLPHHPDSTCLKITWFWCPRKKSENLQRHKKLCENWVHNFLERPGEIDKNLECFLEQLYRTLLLFPDLKKSEEGKRLWDDFMKETPNVNLWKKQAVRTISFREINSWFYDCTSHPEKIQEFYPLIKETLADLRFHFPDCPSISWICNVCEALTNQPEYLSKPSDGSHHGLSVNALCQTPISLSGLDCSMDGMSVEDIFNGLNFLEREHDQKIALACIRIMLEKRPAEEWKLYPELFKLISQHVYTQLDGYNLEQALPRCLEETLILWFQYIATLNPNYFIKIDQDCQMQIFDIYFSMCRFQPIDLRQNLKKCRPYFSDEELEEIQQFHPAFISEADPQDDMEKLFTLLYVCFRFPSDQELKEALQTLLNIDPLSIEQSKEAEKKLLCAEKRQKVLKTTLDDIDHEKQEILASVMQVWKTKVGDDKFEWQDILNWLPKKSQYRKRSHSTVSASSNEEENES